MMIYEINNDTCGAKKMIEKSNNWLFATCGAYGVLIQT